jgi:hypothetical protein
MQIATNKKYRCAYHESGNCENVRNRTNDVRFRTFSEKRK